ncbi:hypothetical protein TNCV_1355351 [Trichonephila clavipes]|uniref:Uncharacterized protein n=1 Tax=Trichonephila clavipes TaxID=2585209 RepID=A0A8X6V7U6_TRICX|nr:hypothetical protein TNCV_1355351 [Trichonephila clavipes]
MPRSRRDKKPFIPSIKESLTLGVFASDRSPPNRNIYPCTSRPDVTYTEMDTVVLAFMGCCATELRTATAGSDVVQSGRPIFDDFFQHLWPYIGNNTANVVFQMVKRLWLIRIDQ